MRKILIVSIILFTTLFCGCNKNTDYTEYISEMRSDIYYYADDDISIKIYISERENPYSADGIKGDTHSMTEIFVTLPKTYEEVNISLSDIEGEMSYKAVQNCYFLSCSDKSISDETVQVTLTYGDNSEKYNVSSVLYDGVISGTDALNCVIEHDTELFTSLTQNRIFDGEIFIRLLYDDGCYYYVGVCDRQKTLTAYLVDGERGKIITKRQTTA